MGPTPKLRHPRRAEGEKLLRQAAAHEARGEAALTTRQIAARVGVSREAVRQWRHELGLPALPRGRRPMHHQTQGGTP